MNEESRSALTEHGIDYQKAMERFADREDLYEKFLIKFLKDPSYFELKEAMEKQDVEAAFRGAHALKGTCALLSMKKLFEDTSELVEVLRAKDMAGSLKPYEQVEKSYQDAAFIIRKYVCSETDGIG